MKSNSNKTLKEEIRRIKSLFYENFNKKSFDIDGDIKSPSGLKIKLVNEDDLGTVGLVNFKDAWDIDYDIVRFHNDKNDYCQSKCEDNFFNENNSVYLHSLHVNDNYRGLGYGKEIMNKCYEISKDMGYNYILLITSCDNNVAQNMYRGLGYEVHQTDGRKDFFYKKLN
jgi:ribosomal protein S18 acetylase RimI-like enzyme